MIHYALQCDAGHGFDGWFRNIDAFDQQVARRLLSCPQCGHSDVRRAIMAPAVVAARAEVPVPPPEVQADAARVSGPMPAAVVALFQRLREEVERSCEDMGEQFVEEARRIAAGDSEERGIYGQATPEDAEALREEGIEVHAIPWVPRADG